MNCIILMSKGVPSTPIITETEQEAHSTFVIMARAYLDEYFDEVVGDDFNGIVNDYCYNRVNEFLSHSGHQILFFKNLHVQK